MNRIPWNESHTWRTTLRRFGAVQDAGEATGVASTLVRRGPFARRRNQGPPKSTRPRKLRVVLVTSEGHAPDHFVGMEEAFAVNVDVVYSRNPEAVRPGVTTPSWLQKESFDPEPDGGANRPDAVFVCGGIVSPWTNGALRWARTYGIPSVFLNTGLIDEKNAYDGPPPDIVTASCAYGEEVVRRHLNVPDHQPVLITGNFYLDVPFRRRVDPNHVVVLPTKPESVPATIEPTQRAIEGLRSAGFRVTVLPHPGDKTNMFGARAGMPSLNESLETAAAVFLVPGTTTAQVAGRGIPTYWIGIGNESHADNFRRGMQSLCASADDKLRAGFADGFSDFRWDADNLLRYVGPNFDGRSSATMTMLQYVMPRLIQRVPTVPARWQMPHVDDAKGLALRLDRVV